MKILDVHNHSCSLFDSKDVLAKMEKAGVYGGTIFSDRPACFFGNKFPDPRERLDVILKACASSEGRLLPVLWIHPDEDGVLDLIQEAAERGIAGFKCICNNFYPNSDKSLRMIEAVGKTGKPIMFHSGILWDDSPSSKYNRPLHWEELCVIPNLRFSLAHCSWPWYDECIAMYGKFLTNHRKHPELNNEMFFDLTPGTPVPYRRDLLTKLLYCGYDVSHNIMWGTDCSAEDYNSEWSEKWVRIDNAIMDEIGIDAATKERIFHENAERFFGLSKEVYMAVGPTSDGR